MTSFSWMERCCKGAFGYTQRRVQSIIAIIVPEMAYRRHMYCQEISTRLGLKQFGLNPLIWNNSIIFDHPILPYINWVLGLYNDHIPEVLLPECLFLGDTTHSDRRLLTGFTSAALMLWKLIVSKPTPTESAAANRNTQTSISIL